MGPTELPNPWTEDALMPGSSCGNCHLPVGGHASSHSFSVWHKCTCVLKHRGREQTFSERKGSQAWHHNGATSQAGTGGSRACAVPRPPSSGAGLEPRSLGFTPKPRHHSPHTRTGSHTSGRVLTVETDPAYLPSSHRTELTQRVSGSEAPAGTVFLANVKATQRGSHSPPLVNACRCRPCYSHSIFMPISKHFFS